MSEKEMIPELPPCGIPFLETAKRTEYFLRMAWHLTQKYFRLTGAELSAKGAKNKSYRKAQLNIQAKIVGINQKDIVIFEKYSISVFR